MGKLREIEILGYMIQKKSVTAARLAHDLNMSLVLAARWLGYFHQKGWLFKDLLAPYNRRYLYRLSPAAENILQKVKSRDDTWAKVAWFGLGALLAIALAKGIKRKKPQVKQVTKTRKQRKK